MTTRERRCERSDLPETMCAHCLGHDGSGIPDELDHIQDTPDHLDPDELGPVFTARFDGRCSVCDSRINAGTSDIAMLTDGSGVACAKHLP